MNYSKQKQSTTVRTAALSAAFLISVALPISVAAQTSAIGTPVTSQNSVDVQNMIRIADALDAAVDAKDWETARSLFTDEIRVDFTSLIGGEPATIPADGLIQGWSSNLTANKTSFHLRGNHRVTFDSADSAVMVSHGYAWNRMDAGALEENGGDPLWEVWGTYEHGFERTDAGWQVSSMSFTATAERGNPYVRNTPGS